MRHRTPRARAGLLALTLVAALAAATGVGSAAVTAGPQLETVLAAGGIGDGGAAAAALVDAGRMFRMDNGDLVFRDTAAGGFRRVGATDGMIDAAPEIPALPAQALGAGTVRDGRPVGPDAVYLVVDASAQWVVRVEPSGEWREVYRATKRTGFYADVRAVGPDGALVVSRYDAAATDRYTTVLVDPHGGADRVLLTRSSSLAAVAADGTVFAVTFADADVPVGTGAGRRIERIGPNGAVDVIGGPGPATPAAAGPDGMLATASAMDVRALAVTPAGDRVVYVEQVAFKDGTVSRSATVVRSFAVGGEVTTVAGEATRAGTACTLGIPAVLADAQGALVACGGIRSYAYDGSARPRAGSVVAGVNSELDYSDADSPSGTPTALAFLGKVRDVAGDPRTGRAAMVTRLGAYTVTGSGAGARLVRVLGTGAAPRAAAWPRPGDADTAPDLAYGPDGTAYLLAPDPADATGNRWRLQSAAPDGTVRVLAAGTGPAAPSAGNALGHTVLTVGHVAVSPDGGTLYLAQDRAVWAVSLATGVLRPVVAGTVPWEIPVSWLGVDPTTAEVLVADQAGLWRVDAQGVARRAAGVPGGSTYAATSDGSVYAVPWDGPTVWRIRPDGAHVVAAGTHPDLDTPVGVALTHPMVAAMSDGRLVLADAATNSTAVRVLRPADGVLTGPAPGFDAVAAFVPDRHTGEVTVRLDVPKGDTPWQVQVRAAAGSEVPLPGRSDGSDVLHGTIAPGASRTASFARFEDGYGVGPDAQPLLPGQRLTLALYAWQGDGSAAPPPVLTRVTVPSAPAKIVVQGLDYDVVLGTGTTISALLQGDLGSTAGEVLHLEARRDKTKEWVRVASVRIPPDAWAQVLYNPTWRADVRWVHDASERYGAAATEPWEIIVHRTLTTSIPDRVKKGHNLTATGTVTPAQKGVPVKLQRYSGGKWSTLATTTTNSAGAYTLKAKVTKSGGYRAYQPGADGVSGVAKFPTKVTVFK